MSETGVVTASDWIKGIALSVAASIIGGASKLAIRKSWLMEKTEEEGQNRDNDDGSSSPRRYHQAVFQQDVLVPDAAHVVQPSSTEDGFDEDYNVCAQRKNYSPPPLAPQETFGTATTTSMGTSTSVVSSTDHHQQSPTNKSPRLSSLKNSIEQKKGGYSSISMVSGNARSSSKSNDAVDDHKYHAFDVEDRNISDTTNHGGTACARLLPRSPCGVHVIVPGDNEDAEDEVGSSSGDDEDNAIQASNEQAAPQRGIQHQRRKVCVAYSLRGGGMIGMTFLNPLCSVLAMQYASPSILAPFSGLTLVWIILFSQPLIGEQPTSRQVLAASLIVLGEIVVAVYGDHTNGLQDATLEELRQSYLSVPFLVYTGCLLVWMLLLWYWMANEHSSRTLKRFSWGMAGGSITGLQNFLKDSLTILKTMEGDQPHHAWEDTTVHDNSLRNRVSAAFTAVTNVPWYLPLMIFLAIATAFGGLLLLTACMKRYDATYSAAMFVGSFVISATIMSAVHYSTFSHLHSVVNWIMYPGGLVILMSGIWLLIDEKQENEQEEDDGYDDERDGTQTRVDGENVSAAATVPVAMTVSSDSNDPGRCGSPNPDDLRNDENISPRHREMQKPFLSKSDPDGADQDDLI